MRKLSVVFPALILHRLFAGLKGKKENTIAVSAIVVDLKALCACHRTAVGFLDKFLNCYRADGRFGVRGRPTQGDSLEWTIMTAASTSVLEFGPKGEKRFPSCKIVLICIREVVTVPIV